MRTNRIAPLLAEPAAPASRLHVQIRWLIRRDMDDVLGIERESSERPWSEEDFLLCVRQRNCIGMVAEGGGRIVGFMMYALHYKQLEILNFGVSQEHRRMGVGSQMVTRLIGKLAAKRNVLWLRVRETNVAAQLFFRSQRFLAVDVLADWYEDTGEDGYVMEYRLAAEAREEAA